MAGVRAVSRPCGAIGGKVLLALVAVLGTGLASTANAEPYNLEGHRIVSVATGWGGEGFYLVTQGVLPAGSDCGGGNRFILLNDHPMQREMVSMLLIAWQNKLRVGLRVDGCTSGVMQLRAVTLPDV
ncbi:TPA: hypothetical protein UM521_000760 [Stenotrophomonas maltophilia]|uniref:hypothetical protein n=1 Tax=Stenotrophomonas TaxID=40323 RepID=UPI00066D46AD|nr:MULTISPECIES: hypothetical protein [Stenotrophomonas]MBC9114376.1 hypothetical protein [Stenotrophomonas maltophilia]MBH1463980.1 hypothetical protein [Stenotrophomonas maltophilia]MBH1604306.1 hypothetical protein [Stenotrophomonas maltophilia]MBH1615827.1 hypothetical protein [Stenotrophomonas maltophilia]MBN5079972.1 hypothetical protein [Stenotrophomonas maltophilia]